MTKFRGLGWISTSATELGYMWGNTDYDWAPRAEWRCQQLKCSQFTRAWTGSWDSKIIPTNVPHWPEPNAHSLEVPKTNSRVHLDSFFWRNFPISFQQEESQLISHLVRYIRSNWFTAKALNCANDLFLVSPEMDTQRQLETLLAWFYDGLWKQHSW